MKVKIDREILFIAFFAVFFTALIGSILTYSAIHNVEWYNSVKPSLTPPNFVFPIAWSIIFFLIFISFYLSLVSGEKCKLKTEMIFMLNLFLNVFWTVLYFFLKNPLLAFFDLILLWCSIIALIYCTHRINKTAAYLLVPYLLWVSFAGILNYLSAFG